MATNRLQNFWPAYDRRQMTVQEFCRQMLDRLERPPAPTALELEAILREVLQINRELPKTAEHVDDLLSLCDLVQRIAWMVVGPEQTPQLRTEAESILRRLRREIQSSN